MKTDMSTKLYLDIFVTSLALSLIGVAKATVKQLKRNLILAVTLKIGFTTVLC